MEAKKTSISAGETLRAILLEDPAVSRLTRKVFPVCTDEAQLPYILYRRASLQHDAVKAGRPGADTVQMEVAIYTAGYTEGVELAEAVRSALDYSERRSALPPLRSCTLTGGEEGYEGDAYVQELIFTLKI